MPEGSLHDTLSGSLAQYSGVSTVDMQQSYLTALAPSRRPAIKLATRVPTVSVQAVRPSSEHGGMGPPEAAPVLLLAVKTVLVASAVSAVAAQPAFARGWHERRHHRRMQDQFATPQQVRLEGYIVARCTVS